MKRWQDRLFQIIVFLVPSNLAYHFFVDQAYVNGRLFDYLIPKFYLSDIFILILLGYWLLQLTTWRRFSAYAREHVPALTLIASTLLVILLSGSQTTHPQSFIWLFLKIVQLSLFFIFIITSYTLERFLRIIWVPLTAASIFQSVIAIAQYINQKEIIGYFLLGEPNLDKIATISQAQSFGSLKLLPYGTTPHPNVLAGFLAFVAITINSIRIYNPKHDLIKWLSIFTTGLALLLCFITQAITTIIILSGTLLLGHLHNYSNSRRRTSMLTLLLSGSVVIVTLIITVLSYHSYNSIDKHSIDRRYKLNQVAISQILDSPLLGKGLNHTIPAMIGSGNVPTAPFIQPPHNIYLLWIAEVGLAGLLLIAWILIGLIKCPKNLLKRWYLSLPLVSLLLIGFADHYPLSLQTGQLLLVLSLAIATLNFKSIR